MFFVFVVVVIVVVVAVAVAVAVGWSVGGLVRTLVSRWFLWDALPAGAPKVVSLIPLWPSCNTGSPNNSSYINSGNNNITAATPMVTP